MNDEMDYLEHYDKYNDEQIEGYAIHDDMMSDVMNDIREFKKGLSGKESQEELMRLIYQKSDQLGEKYPEIGVEHIFNAIVKEFQTN